MKKLLFVFAIAAFASCNNAAETPAVTVDSPVIEAPVVDTAAAVVVDTTAVAAPAPAAQ